MKESLSKLLRRVAPRSLKARLYREASAAIARDMLSREAEMPRTDLKARHLAEARLLSDRQALLASLPSGGIVAEIGVAAGDFSADILRIALPERLILIDAWHSNRYGDALRKSVEARFAAERESSQLEIIRGLSIDACARLKDDSLDWAYIDTDHSYETTRDELKILSKKVRLGGWICGHGYACGYWPHLRRYGVVEAVHEFCAKHDWQLGYLTMEQRVMPSFAIRRS